LTTTKTKIGVRLWTVFAGNGISSIGSGLVLPFTLIYLIHARGMPAPLAGAIVATQPLVSAATAPVIGAVADRAGTRKVFILVQFVGAAGTLLMGIAYTPALAFPASALLGLSWVGNWIGIRTLIAELLPPRGQRRALALQNGMLNFGIGLGGVVAGFVAAGGHAASYFLLFALNSVSFIVYGVVLIFLPGWGVAPHNRQDAQSHGYREVLRDRLFILLLLLSFGLVSVGWAQLQSGFPGYVIVAGGSTKVIGYASAANTLVIVVFQAFVISRGDRRPAPRSLVVVGLIWAASWLLIYVTGIMRGSWLNPLGFILALAIFAVAESMFANTVPVLVARFAPKSLIGRYTGALALVNTAARGFGPLIAGAVLGTPHPGLLIAGLAVMCALLSVAAGLLATPISHRLSSARSET
jgi:MFS family permease